MECGGVSMKAPGRLNGDGKVLTEALSELIREETARIMEETARYLKRTGAQQALWSELLHQSATESGTTRDSHELGVPTRRRWRKRQIAFGWYGGKFNHLNWLLPLLPYTRHYCEPFGGSAAVLLNREPSPVETYNDIDGEVVNFFSTLRDGADELIRSILLTPFSREEFAKACEYRADLPPLERARRFFVRARQVRTGLAQTASIGRWANCKNTSRAGMAGAVSRWLGSIQSLPEIAARLLRVQIENRDAIEVVKLYDSTETLFYCDPPYLHSTRGDPKAYKYEMTEQQHACLARELNSLNGKVAISGYPCPLMNELYEGWRRVDAPVKNCHSVKKPRMEALWMNY